MEKITLKCKRNNDDDMDCSKLSPADTLLMYAVDLECIEFCLNMEDFFAIAKNDKATEVKKIFDTDDQVTGLYTDFLGIRVKCFLEAK